MKSKKYILIPVLIVVYGMLSSCSRKTDWNVYGLHGKVKSVTERQYEAEKESSKWVKGEIKEGFHHKNFFNRSGNHELIEVLNNDNSVREKIIIKRENDKLVEETIYNSEGEIIGKVLISNHSDDEMEYTTIGEDGEKTSEGKIWFEDGILKKQKMQFFEDGEKESEILMLFSYDENGNVSSKKQMDEKGEIQYIDTYKYVEFDTKKNWTKRLDFPYKEYKTPSKVVIREYEYY